LKLSLHPNKDAESVGGQGRKDKKNPGWCPQKPTNHRKNNRDGPQRGCSDLRLEGDQASRMGGTTNPKRKRSGKGDDLGEY